MLQSLGTAGAEVELGMPLVLTGLGLEIIIVATAYFAARRCRQVSPAEAIRYGVRVLARRSRLAERIWNLPRLPMVAGLALRSWSRQAESRRPTPGDCLCGHDRVLFHQCGALSINRIGANLAQWGWDNADVNIVRGGRRSSITHEEFLERMRKTAASRELFRATIRKRKSRRATTSPRA